MQIFSDFLFAYYIAKFKKKKKSSKFPSIVTLADTIPVFNKGDKGCKNDYRPVSILSNMSKILERIISRQLSSFMESFFFQSISVAFENVVAHNIAFCLWLKNEDLR